MAQYAQQNGKDWQLRKNTPVMWNDDGTFISLETLEGMGDAACKEFGVPRIPEPDGAGMTDGHVEIERKLIDVRGWPEWHVTYGEAPEVILPPLPNISDRQFSSGLCRLGMITFDEALAFTGNGTIPPMLQAMVDTLPSEAPEGELSPRQDAMMFLAGAKEYEFAHPLVDVLRQAQGWTPEKLREEWTVWLTL